MVLLSITEVTPLEGFCLRLRLTDGSVIEREVSGLLAGPVFEPVKSNPAVFSRSEQWMALSSGRMGRISARTS